MTRPLSWLGAAVLAFASIGFSGPGWAQGRGPGLNDPRPVLVETAVTAVTLDSVQTLARDRQGAIVTNRVLASILGGFNEQINCNNCISAFGEVGSFSAGMHGRKAITDDLSIVGGIAFAKYHSGGVDIRGMPLAAGSLRYDFTELGVSRPYFEAGGILAPSGRVNFTRQSAAGAFLGFGTADIANAAAFARAGWVYRFTPQDEASVAAEISRNWQRVGSYGEALSPINPVPLFTGGGTDEMNIAKIGGQWTHLWGAVIETQVNIGVARSFGSRSGLNAVVTGNSITPVLGEHSWAEYGARLGYRIQPNVILEAFADGTLGPGPIRNTVHGGVAVRYTF